MNEFSIVKNTPWSHIHSDVGKFCILNNTWGLNNSEVALTRHSIWFNQDAGLAGWEAQIPLELFEASKVRSYQQIYRGQKDINLPDTKDPLLGKQLGSYDSLRTSIAIECVGQTMLNNPEGVVDPDVANVAAEIFLHSSPISIIDSNNPDLDTRRFELMVWSKQPPPSISIGTPVAELGGALIYVRETPLFPLVTFIIQEEVIQQSIDWLALFNWCRERFPNIDFDRLFVNAVEAGTEVWSGHIKATVSAFVLEATFKESVPDPVIDNPSNASDLKLLRLKIKNKLEVMGGVKRAMVDGQCTRLALAARMIDCVEDSAELNSQISQIIISHDGDYELLELTYLTLQAEVANGLAEIDALITKERNGT